MPCLLPAHACTPCPARRPPAGKLLADWRRINVAITRARKKLLLVGDATTLRSIPLFARMVALVQERGWYLALPPSALA